MSAVAVPATPDAAIPVGGPVVGRVAIIGIGLIGSSLARGLAALRDEGKPVAAAITLFDRSESVRARARALGLGDTVAESAAEAAAGADLVILCVPLGAYPEAGAAIAPALKPGAILSDVGSVKQSVIRDLGSLLPEGVHLVPGHPVAGTEHSGPDAGFATLFRGRWCILTPPPGTDAGATARVAQLWAALGSEVEVMEPGHHDLVLAVTSHLPHLIAFTIVGTASDLEGVTNREVVKFSAGGFRDFTRIAASDPVMWRDVFLNNKDAVLEMLQRFSEDLTALQRAIRWGEGDRLEALFARTRAIRRSLIEAKQV